MKVREYKKQQRRQQDKEMFEYMVAKVQFS